MGYYCLFFSFLGEKNILNLLENSGLKSRFLFCLIFQFYLMYRLICQKPAYILSAQMALVSSFFQMSIVLWMYNFGGQVLILVDIIFQKTGCPPPPRFLRPWIFCRSTKQLLRVQKNKDIFWPYQCNFYFCGEFKLTIKILAVVYWRLHEILDTVSYLSVSSIELTTNHEITYIVTN